MRTGSAWALVILVGAVIWRVGWAMYDRAEERRRPGYGWRPSMDENGHPLGEDDA